MPDDVEEFFAQKAKSTAPQGDDVDAFFREKSALGSPGYTRSVIAGGVEAIPLGQKITAAGSAGLLGLLKKFGSDPSYQNLDTSYEGNLKRVRGEHEAALAEHPNVTRYVGGGLGAAASFGAIPGPAKAAASMAGRVGQAALQGLKYGLAHGVLNNDTAESRLQAGAEEGGVNALIGAAGHTLLGEAVPKAIKYLAPEAKKLAGLLKFSSLSPTKSMGEEAAAIPGGEAGVGETLLEKKAGAMTHKGTARQLEGLIKKTTEEINDAAVRADMAPYPGVKGRPTGYDTASGNGDPAEIDAVVKKIASELGPPKPAEGMHENDPVYLKAVKEYEQAMGSGVPPPEVEAEATAPGGRRAKPSEPVPPTLNQRLIEDARKNVVEPLKNHEDVGVKRVGNRLDKYLNNLTKTQGPGNSAQDAIKMYRNVRELANYDRDSANFAYNSEIKKVARGMRRGAGDFIHDVSPEISQDYEGANLADRRLILGKEMAEDAAHKHNKLFGLHDLALGGAAGGAATYAGHSPASIPAAILGTKLMSRYGPQMGARALYSGTRFLENPETQRVLELLGTGSALSIDDKKRALMEALQRGP